MNVEGMYSIYFYKKMERSDSTLRNSIFVIRYSAVRCLARLAAAKADSLIIKKPRHFGVVSCERLDFQTRLGHLFGSFDISWIKAADELIKNFGML